MLKEELQIKEKNLDLNKKEPQKELQSNKKNNVDDTYDSRVIQIRRTTKVREGGRDFGFSAISVVGDGKNLVGFGCGKAKEVVTAVQKSIDNARKNMKYIELNGESIQHIIRAKHDSSKIILIPGSDGTGIIAGGAMRPVFEVIGIKNIIAKSIGSRNPNNVVRATIKGLLKLSSVSYIAAKRGFTVKEIFDKNK